MRELVGGSGGGWEVVGNGMRVEGSGGWEVVG